MALVPTCCVTICWVNLASLARRSHDQEVVNWRSWYNAWDLLLMWYREAMKVVSFDTPKGCRIWCVRQSIDIGCNKFNPLITILSILAIMRGLCSGKHNSKINSYNNYMHESSWAVYWQNNGGRERFREWRWRQISAIFRSMKNDNFHGLTVSHQ